MCRSRRELSNAYFVANFGFDTAENEPGKVCPLSVYRSPRVILFGGIICLLLVKRDLHRQQAMVGEVALGGSPTPTAGGRKFRFQPTPTSSERRTAV